MSAPQHESTSTGKARAPDYEERSETTANGGGLGLGQGGFKPHNEMTVQPPTKEDLQRSYARVVAEDANPKGWYGTMSMSYTCNPLFSKLIANH